MKKTAFISSIFIYLSVFVCFFFKYAVNVPYSDDYSAVYDNIWQQNVFHSSLKKGLHPYFFDTNLEHFIVYVKGISILFYAVLKHNFSVVYLMIIGTIAWFLNFIFIFIYFFKKSKPSVYWFLPFLLFGCSLQLHENIFWGMAAAQNFTVIPLVVLSLYFVLNEKPFSFFLSVIFSFIAFFTSSPALFMIFVIIGILIFKREIKKTLGYIALLGILYFCYKLKAPQYAQTFPTNVDYFNIFRLLGGVVHFEGINFFSTGAISGILGSVICVFVLFIFIKYPQKRNENLFYFGVFGFSFLTAVALGIKREEVLISRYKIYSVLTIIAIIPLIYNYISIKYRKCIFTILVFFGVTYQVINLLVYPYEIRKHYEFLVADTYNRAYNNKICIQFHTPCNNNYYYTILESLKIKNPIPAEIETIRSFLKKNESSIIFKRMDTPILGKFNFTYQKKMNESGCELKVIDVKFKTNNIPNWKNKYFLVLTSAQKHYLYSIFPEKTPNLFNITKGQVFTNQINQKVYAQYIESDEYRFSIILMKDGKIVEYILMPSNNNITF